jgi:hypothetical protein
MSIFELYLLKRLEKLMLDSGYTFSRWPLVYWGDYDECRRAGLVNDLDEEPVSKDVNIYDIDYLGMYVHPHDKEGYILMFKDRITRTSKRFADELSLSAENSIDYLQTIVLIHEIGHWFTHWCHGENHVLRTEGFSYQSTEIIETMAQLSVVWALLRLKNERVKRINLIFQYLTDQTSRPYRLYQNLGKKQSHVKTILKRYHNLLEGKNYGVSYLLTGVDAGMFSKY